MTKKNLSFVQVNFQIGPQELNAFYLPYTAGVILAYALANNPDWHCEQIVWRRQPIETVAQKLARSDLVAFSVYVWNHGYSYALAKRIKQLNPECVIVMGGPEVAITDPDLFEKHPWMDLVIKLEGEKTFSTVLGTDPEHWSQVPGVLINRNGSRIDTGDSERISDLDELPSPYLTGVFDQLIADNPDVTWNGTIETNRGCPFQCTFCDWGSLTYNKVKKFRLERVFDELEWLGQHCAFVTFTDANFGMFVERDNMIVDKLIEVQLKYKKITSYGMTWAKNQKNEVVDIVRKLIDRSPTATNGLTVSVQSMDEQVLDIIKRRNLEQHKIQEIFSLCDRWSIPVYTELIIGLPGETVHSWKENFWQLFRAGNHNGVVVLHSQMLENAEMNLGQKKFYQLETRAIEDYISGFYHHDTDGIVETIDVVIGTRDIPHHEMLNLWVWNGFVQTFHINGLSNWLARYAARHGMDYSEFYDQLWQVVCEDPWWARQFELQRELYTRWVTDGRVNHAIGTIRIPGWNLHNRFTLTLNAEDRIGDTFVLLDRFLQQRFGSCTDQLLQFQFNTVIQYHQLRNPAAPQTFDYDFWGYLVENRDLDHRVTYQFSTQEDPYMSFDTFLENFYFGRKRNFGKARITTLDREHVNDTHEPTTGERLHC